MSKNTSEGKKRELAEYRKNNYITLKNPAKSLNKFSVSSYKSR